MRRHEHDGRELAGQCFAGEPTQREFQGQRQGEQGQGREQWESQYRRYRSMLKMWEQAALTEKLPSQRQGMLSLWSQRCSFRVHFSSDTTIYPANLKLKQSLEIQLCHMRNEQ